MTGHFSILLLSLNRSLRCCFSTLIEQMLALAIPSSSLVLLTFQTSLVRLLRFKPAAHHVASPPDPSAVWRSAWVRRALWSQSSPEWSSGSQTALFLDSRAITWLLTAAGSIQPAHFLATTPANEATQAPSLFLQAAIGRFSYSLLLVSSKSKRARGPYFPQDAQTSHPRCYRYLIAHSFPWSYPATLGELLAQAGSFNHSQLSRTLCAFISARRLQGTHLVDLRLKPIILIAPSLSPLSCESLEVCCYCFHLTRRSWRKHWPGHCASHSSLLVARMPGRPHLYRRTEPYLSRPSLQSSLIQLMCKAAQLCTFSLDSHLCRPNENGSPSRRRN